MYAIDLRETLAQFRDNDEIDTVVLAFPELRPLYRSIFRAAFEASDLGHLANDTAKAVSVFESDMGYFPDESNNLPLGEILFSDSEIYVLRPLESRLAVYSIRRHDAVPSIDMFCEKVTKVARERLDGRRLRSMQFDWKAVEPKASIQSDKTAKLTSQPPTYSADQLQKARLLVDSEVRSFILSLAKLRGRVRAADADKDLPPIVRDRLLKEGLISKEYLVSCKQDSRTIFTVHKKEDLEEGVFANTSCAVCGRLFKDEMMHEIYVLSEQAEKLCQKSHWMTIWITDLLNNMGIPKDKIAWNAVAGEDEIDIIVDIYGLKVFIELKDREFGIGDAYPFLYRIERFGGTAGVVITTNTVSQEAKRLFAERGRSSVVSKVVPIEVIEKTASISDVLKTYVNKLSQEPIVKICVATSLGIGIDPRPLIEAWLTKNQYSRP